MSKKRLTLMKFVLLLTAPFGAAASMEVGHTQGGIASYYHDKFHGRTTASGEIYNKRALSAAHKTLPLGTKVRVTKLSDGKSIVVRINDRGPFVKGRIVDLSRRAARELGIIRSGLAKVKLEVLSTP